MSMPPRPKWRRPAAIEMVAMAALPIVGIVWFEWSGLQILLLYWFENAMLGVFSVLRMALSRPVYEHRADFIAAHPWLLQHYPMNDAEWEAAEKLPVKRHPSYKEFIIPFFIGHYTFFLGVHAFLLATLVKRLPPTGWLELFSTEWSDGMVLALVSMAAAHGWRFWQEDLQGRAYTRTSPFLGMIYPYRQLLIMHVALFLGGLALAFYALPASLAILLILLKSGFDMNWIRIPIGPKRIDWKAMADHDREDKSGEIISRTVSEKPGGCPTVLKEGDECLSFEVGPRGIGDVWRRMRAGGCLFVGLVMLGGASVFAGAFLWDYCREMLQGRAGYWTVLGVMTIGQVVGTIWLLMFSLLISVPWSVVDYGTVQGSIRLADGQLTIQQRRLLRRRRETFSVEDIVDLGISDTGNRTNEFSVLQLRLRFRNGDERTFFTGRDADELNWISTQLLRRMTEGT